jgi:hypothetical protein
MRTRCYPSDLTDARSALVAPHIPAAKSGGRPRTTDVRAVFDAIIYLQARVLRVMFGNSLDRPISSEEDEEAYQSARSA